MQSQSKVVIVTGAASGIGLALVNLCLDRGFSVVMADNMDTLLAKQAGQLDRKYPGKLLAVLCDVTKPDSVKKLAGKALSHFQRIDWLFNNAGISGRLAAVWELTREEIRKVLEVNLYGAIEVTQAFLPLMFAQEHSSHVINMASLYGLCSSSQLAAYTMSKHALVAFSESLYFDLKRLKKEVNVSVVCPAFVNTNLLINSAAYGGDSKFEEILTQFMASSRSASQVAEHIIQEVLNKTFYILPDEVVKTYFEQRVQAIIDQTVPHSHHYETMLTRISELAQMQ